MEFIDKILSDYVEAHTSPEDEVLRKLHRDTHAHVLMPRMISGHLQGRVLSMFSHMLKPLYILEIGTFTGYSAICLSEGLQDGGMLFTIDINEELESMARNYFKEAKADHKINYQIGNALSIIPTIEHTFDLVFIDADKVNYSNYYQLIIKKVRKGGIIIADNVLWNGQVVDSQKKDKELIAIKKFNEMVQNDTNVENVIFPIRDGLMVVRKK
jgi:caffeoyl-CoA O-methyltransferase